MSDEQTQCATCGALILVLTAKETGGVCMVCARGTREEFESNRRRSREIERSMAEYRKSPQHLFWVQLVNTVHDKGIESVSVPEQNYFGVGVLQGEVFNGGFHQYFSNSSADYYAAAERGLSTLGATMELKILRDAKELIFGAGLVPDWEARNDRLEALEENKSVNAALDNLDQTFCREDLALSALMERYAVDNGFYPPPAPTSA